MSRPTAGWRVFADNLAWMASCLPEVFSFWLTSFRRPAAAPGGNAPTEYEDMRGDLETIRRTGQLPTTGERVLRLVPTSGTTSAPKLIPYTASLLREVQRAFDAWVGSLYLAYPSLLFGRHYWSLSPNTEPPVSADSVVPIGFGDDADYLRPSQRHRVRRLWVTPPEVTRVSDPDAFNYLTLLFMIRERNLRLISVWHPSFLTLLLDAFPRHRDLVVETIRSGSLPPIPALAEETRAILSQALAPDEPRAREVAAVSPEDPAFAMKLWPRLRVISCWTERNAELWVDELRRRFPGVAIQPKGLVATEGVVSFPWGRRGRRVCAVRSHRIEFEDPETGEVVQPADVKVGQTYGVLLTTGGGLRRYRLHDRVCVEGFFHRVPCLRFLGRDGQTSDVVGEKLGVAHVEEILKLVRRVFRLDFRFALLAPARRGSGWKYVLYVEGDERATDWPRVAEQVETELCRNYHYLHARRRGQLGPVAIRLVSGDAAAAYRRHAACGGTRLGDVKFSALSTRTDWDEVLSGQDVSGRHVPPGSASEA